MTVNASFKAAFPYGADVLALPVDDMESAASWYAEHFGLVEAERRTTPHRTVIMERDGVRIGFAENGGNSAEDGAAILVDDATAVRVELESRGVKTANWRVDERDGQRLQVFFVVAPDGLCYYFHQLIDV